MPKIQINGVTREMTEAETEAYARRAAEIRLPEPDPAEQRLDEIEAALIELAALMAGGV